MGTRKHITHIVSLPRCRTAWLSATLTGGNCFAYHDLCGECKTTGEYESKLDIPECSNIVDCSSALMFRPDILAESAERIVVIERDHEKCRRSMLAHVGNAELVRQIWPLVMDAFDKTLEMFADKIVSRFRFDELSDTSRIRDLWAICAPGEPFDYLRVSRLQNLHINERKRPEWQLH